MSMWMLCCEESHCIFIYMHFPMFWDEFCNGEWELLETRGLDASSSRGSLEAEEMAGLATQVISQVIFPTVWPDHLIWTALETC